MAISWQWQHSSFKWTSEKTFAKAAAGTAAESRCADGKYWLPQSYTHTHTHTNPDLYIISIVNHFFYHRPGSQRSHRAVRRQEFYSKCRKNWTQARVQRSVGGRDVCIWNGKNGEGGGVETEAPAITQKYCKCQRCTRVVGWPDRHLSSRRTVLTSWHCGVVTQWQTVSKNGHVTRGRGRRTPSSMLWHGHGSLLAKMDNKSLPYRKAAWCSTPRDHDAQLATR